MEKDGLPPAGRYLNVKAEDDISRMPENPPRKMGHRRAHSEILTLPDDISFDSDLGVVSDDTDEDLLSIYFDMDKFNSSSSATSSQDTRVIRHQHSHSMDGSSSIVNIKPEMPDDMSKKAMSAAKLAELALIDPKRAKRIWANRQSAARSKERKMRYIAELERKVQTLQTEATSLSAQLSLLQRDTNGLTAENSELKLRLQTMEQQVHLQDALNDALKEETQHLKVMTGQQQLPNGMNYLGQPYYSNPTSTHSLLTAHQFQQLHIHNYQHQHQHQLHRGPSPTPTHKRDPSPDHPNNNNSSS